MPSITVDSTGVHVQSLSENSDEYVALLRGQLGDDLVGAAETADGQLAGVAALKLSEVSERISASHNATSRERAVGTQLDDFWSPLDVRRLTGSRTQVTARLTGTTGTRVPADSLAATASGDQFRATTEAQIVVGGTLVEMEAIAVGATMVAAGELSQVVTNISGWDGITNPSAAVPGRPQESDDNYRISGIIRAGHSAIGTLDSIRGALYEAGVVGLNPQVHHDSVSVLVQNWFILPHGALMVVEGGTDLAVTRTLLTHRPMGMPYMTAIVGGTPDLGALDAVSSGSLSFAGVDYTGLDLTSSSTSDDKAATLSTLITPLNVHWDGFRFIAVYLWAPGTAPAFSDDTVTQAFGFDPDNAIASPGPFVRPIARAVTVTATVAQRARFPADGRDRITNAVVDVIRRYAIGVTPWLGDVQAAIENVPGTRASAVTMQSSSADISNVEPDLATVWQVATGDVTISFA